MSRFLFCGFSLAVSKKTAKKILKKTKKKAKKNRKIFELKNPCCTFATPEWAVQRGQQPGRGEAATRLLDPLPRAVAKGRGIRPGKLPLPRSYCRPPSRAAFLKAPPGAESTFLFFREQISFFSDWYLFSSCFFSAAVFFFLNNISFFYRHHCSFFFRQHSDFIQAAAVFL